jgi:general secretion pathway protein A
MYTEYLGIKEKPFSITPDPRFLYMSRGHQEALAHLMYGILESGGFVVLTGEVGTGKTSLCRCLLEQLPDNVEIALILNPVLSKLELVATICDEFGVAHPPENQSLKVLIDLLNTYLLDAFARGKHCVLMIDEAQNLSLEVLEQLRLLTNLETDKKKLLQIILVGQPELNALLQRHDMRQLNQRITARYHLTPLGEEEMRAYIRHRLSVVGLKRLIFSADSLSSIYKQSGGVPRLINIICDRCLLAAYAAERGDVDSAMAQSAAREVLIQPAVPKRRTGSPWSWAAAFALVAAVTVLAFFSQSSFSRPGDLDMPMASKAAEQKGPAVQAAPTAELSGQATAGIAKIDKPSTGEANAKPEVPTASANTPGPDTQMAAFALLGDKTKGGQAEDQDALADPVLGGAGLRAALDGLFTLWGQSYAALEGETPCSRARSSRLSCLLGQDGWPGLRNLNRPALVSLNSAENDRVHALVTGLDGDQVKLEIGGYQYESTVAALSPFWSGEYLILWRPPGAFRRVMRQGLQGPDIFWLRLRLASKPEEVDPEKDTFDDKLHNAVIAFQESRALNANGIVDARTLVHLNSIDPTSVVPLLNSDQP